MELHAAFAPFARAFLVEYWEAIASGAFPMAPEESFEQTAAQLMEGVGHELEADGPDAAGVAVCSLRMFDRLGDAWCFRFRQHGSKWELIGATARSCDGTPDHDLLGPTYASCFAPLLRHVSAAAQARMDAARASGGA